MTQPVFKRGGQSVNGHQAAVIDHVEANRTTVASAGAGSGKTHTMVAAVAHLVDTASAHLDDFALITFTRKAAAELRERLVKVVRHRAEADPSWAREEERVAAMFIGTIHAFCLHVLRAYGAGVAVPRDFDTTGSSYHRRLALTQALEEAIENDPETSADLQRFVAPDYELVELAGSVLDYCASKQRSIDQLLDATELQPADPHKGARVAFMRFVANGEAHYRKTKAEEGLLDANDLLSQLAAALDRPDGAMAQAVANRFPCIFIDEFQDTDRTQLKIVEQLLPHLRKLLVVGDRKQAIYGWRAAESSLLDELAARHTRRQPLKLSVSMRPTKALLKAQNALFGNTRYPDLADPLEPSDRDVPSPLDPFVYYSVKKTAAAATMAGHIRGLLGQELPGEDRKIEPGDIAVLTRSNWLAERYAEGLSAQLLVDGVRVVVDQGASLYRTPAVVATYRMLRLILEPRRDMVLSMAAATPYLDDVDLTEDERTVMQYRPEGSLLVDRFVANHPEVFAKIEELRRASRVETTPQLLGRMYRLFDVQAKGDALVLEHLELLRDRARALFASEQALTLRIFVDWLALAITNSRADVDFDELEGRPPHVRVMTIHRAKGLEFPIVFVPSLTSPVVKGEGQPLFFADKDGLDVRLEVRDAVDDVRSPRFDGKVGAEREARIEEEFRLFYVAVTRGQHQVVLVGGSKGPVNPPDSEFYSWRDEVVPARPAITAAGGIFR